jgi:hypothetical protein
MGILSWLFPSDADRLRTARALMAKARWEEARKSLVHCGAPEAEALYEECSRRVDAAEAVVIQKRARAEGFRGWRVEVTGKDARARARLEDLVVRELTSGGVDLQAVAVDEEAVKAAFARAQRKAQNKGISIVGEVKLVPVIAAPR